MLTLSYAAVIKNADKIDDQNRCFKNCDRSCHAYELRTTQMKMEHLHYYLLNNAKSSNYARGFASQIIQYVNFLCGKGIHARHVMIRAAIRIIFSEMFFPFQTAVPNTERYFAHGDRAIRFFFIAIMYLHFGFTFSVN